ncbi:PDR/VanB family oxidoreductase [Glaciecola sp. 33A]|jgi:ferredoxin-NADP reductase|uniref:PDR/VanB family oxidoreductase n=1 Tax=Glaciecola sp. 33A TaxID=2057807 RepID=UPI000C33F12E|nr:PDR/VanB family oxidoreductase [Glaciecola sp. 33A]PKI03049.1 oxidoreductase [Glaciecola sp. 33A]
MNNELVDVIVKSRTEQGAGVAVIELVSADGKPLPPFSAGAHIDVHIGDDLIRQYSLCSDPVSSDIYRIGVLRDPKSRGGSVKLHAEFSEQQIISISFPRNHFPLNENAQKSILAGGGIGITPMIAMAYTLLRKNEDFELHYCTRTKGAGAFEQELVDTFGKRVVFHHDDEGKSQLFSPQTTFKPVDVNTHIYVCGPTGFMDWVISSASEMGYLPAQIHSEYFNAQVDKTGESFEVYCEQSDVTVMVGSDETIARALRKAGIKVNMSCEEGVCGTCITDVLEGEPEHRDHFLTDEEKADNDQMALCCSRAKSSRLVIDL